MVYPNSETRGRIFSPMRGSDFPLLISLTEVLIVFFQMATMMSTSNLFPKLRVPSIFPLHAPQKGKLHPELQSLPTLSYPDPQDPKKWERKGAQLCGFPRPRLVSTAPQPEGRHIFFRRSASAAMAASTSWPAWHRENLWGGGSLWVWLLVSKADQQASQGSPPIFWCVVLFEDACSG